MWRRWPGTWSRRAACSSSWPVTGPRCSRTRITRTFSPRRAPAARRSRPRRWPRQALHDYPDRETAEAVRFDLRWKAAIGAALYDPGFDPSTLVCWRKRIAKSGRPHRVNDAVKTVIEQAGVLKGRRRRAVDSTILADAVATQDTVTQLVSAIRRVAREVPGAAARAAAVCTGHDYSRPGKPKIGWDDPATKDMLVSALVNDANALVEAFRDAELTEPAASALALLALVAGQDVEPAGGSDGTGGRWRIARKVA